MEMKSMQTSGLPRFGNLITRCRREARRIIADGGPHMHYRLGLIGANAADTRDVKRGHDSMLHLLWAHSLEWSAMRRGEEWNALESAPLYWAVGYVMMDWMRTEEASGTVDDAMRQAFGTTFDEG